MTADTEGACQHHEDFTRKGLECVECDLEPLGFCKYEYVHCEKTRTMKPISEIWLRLKLKMSIAWLDPCLCDQRPNARGLCGGSTCSITTLGKRNMMLR